MVGNEEQAARWFAVLRRGIMAQDERVRYDEWRRDPANVARLAELQAVWQALDGAPELGRPADLPQVRPARRLRDRAQVAAMVGFVSIAAVALTGTDSVWWNSLDWWSR